MIIPLANPIMAPKSQKTFKFQGQSISKCWFEMFMLFQKNYVHHLQTNHFLVLRVSMHMDMCPLVDDTNSIRIATPSHSHVIVPWPPLPIPNSSMILVLTEKNQQMSGW